MENYFTISKKQCLEKLNSRKSGLVENEVLKNSKKFGLNKIPKKKKQSNLVRFFKQFADIMIIILLIASAISIVVAIINKTKSELIDGGIILGIVLLNAILGFVQENKADAEMEKLLTLSQPECKVIRNNEITKIKSEELTIGDIVVLEAGDIVPADLRLLESASLKCDESSLTGESHAVEKDADITCSDKTPLAERRNMVYGGSVIVYGRGLGVVTEIGLGTEMGKIAEILQTTEKDITPLQKNIKAVGKIITLLVLGIAGVIFVLEMVARNNILEAFLTAVAVSVAAIPESLPAVITIIMSIGVGRLARQKAIVKRLHAVETLGSCQIICSDKTGTLTQNVMTVQEIYYNNFLSKAVPEMSTDEFVNLTRAMALCNDCQKQKDKFFGDPTETALCDFALKAKVDKVVAEQEHIRVAELPFDSNRKLMSTANQFGDNLIMFTKGAPDEIIKCCSKIALNGEVVEFTEKEKDKVISVNRQMGRKALRVLGFAYKPLKDNECARKNLKEEDLIFVGLVGMMDPPRKEAKRAVEKCRSAGIRPIMITGDHRNTAFAVAEELGIAVGQDEVLTGIELDAMSESQFLKVIDKINVYARVSPENKVRIVTAFKKLGKVVAMTGDGVNDAPSLKNASIGVGMGITGTDITKEVADVIVTDDNFATIVVAVEEGRKIYSNIQKTVQFLFSANMAEILSLFFASIFFPHFSFLLPVQILFTNLITDSLPAIALGLEPTEKDIMKRKPRDSKNNLLSEGIGISILILGMLQTLIVFGIYALAIGVYSPLIATTMAFFTLNLIQFFYVLSVRVKGFVLSSHIFQNKWLLGSIIVAVIFLCIIAFTPVCGILGMTSLSFVQWLIVLGGSFLIFPLSELYKLIMKKIKNKSVKKA